MKKLVFILFLIIVLFIAGCTSNEAPVVKCNKPYLLYNDECCLDNNDNNVCDNMEKYVSDETVTESSDILTVTCPKEVRFSTTESTSKEVEVKFTATYTGFGNNNYATALICDDGYVGNTNPIRVDLEKDQTQNIKSKVTLSPKECTFKLVETANVDNVVSCKFPVKAF
ncbi:MAG: hypothetical protein AABW45_00675 [Nanoarchaeota archaeon]